jgi:hypothetical protein
MTVRIYYFTHDTHLGQATELFGRQRDMVEAIHAKVEQHGSADLLARITEEDYGSDEWTALWEEFINTEGRRCHYYNHGMQQVKEVELFETPAGRIG